MGIARASLESPGQTHTTLTRGKGILYWNTHAIFVNGYDRTGHDYIRWSVNNCNPVSVRVPEVTHYAHEYTRQSIHTSPMFLHKSTLKFEFMTALGVLLVYTVESWWRCKWPWDFDPISLIHDRRTSRLTEFATTLSWRERDNTVHGRWELILLCHTQLIAFFFMYIYNYHLWHERPHMMSCSPLLWWP